jgi:hypothetical protein
VRLLVLGLGLVLVVLAAFSLWLVLNDESSLERVKETARDKRAARSDAERHGPKESSGPVNLELHLRADVPVCLLDGGSRPLVDNQVLNEGSEETFEAERFELRFPEGFDRSQLELYLNDERTRLEDPGTPAAFRISSPDDVRLLGPPPKDCP